MPEWLKGLAWKASIRVTVSGVRIPLSPPLILLTCCFCIDLITIYILYHQKNRQYFSFLSNMAEWLRNIALTEPESKHEMTEMIDRVMHRAGHQSVNPEDVTKLTTNVIVKHRSATYPHS